MMTITDVTLAGHCGDTSRGCDLSKLDEPCECSCDSCINTSLDVEN